MKFVILDRDGTLIAERNYLASPDDVELLPNTAQGLRSFADFGLRRLVVTNQSGIGRGYFTREAMDAVHERMLVLLAESGAGVEAIYACPHAPDDHCDCRKPKTGLVVQAAAEWGFTPSQCVFIGDKASDIELGRNWGSVTILVLTGYGEEELRKNTVRPDFVARDLQEAAEIVMQMNTKNGGDGTAASRDAELFRAHLGESVATKQRLIADGEEAVLAAAAAIVASLSAGGKLLLCGNGGSAADAQHIAGELVSVLSQEFPRRALAAIALTTDSSILTAIANDYGYGGIFERQVQALGREGDVIVGISTSGNSENVVRALQAARATGMRTIAMTGTAGGKILELADVAIRVPSANVQHIQESHIAIAHILCAIVERQMCEAEGTAAGNLDS